MVTQIWTLQICIVLFRFKFNLKFINEQYKLFKFKGTDHVGTFMGLKCVIYYANYRSGNQSSKIQVVP